MISGKRVFVTWVCAVIGFMFPLSSFANSSAYPTTTLAATNITQTSATLRGQVDNLLVNWELYQFFNFGPINPPAPQFAAVPVFIPALTPGLADFTYAATGLQCNTTYYHKAKVDDLDGDTGSGIILSFTTLPCASADLSITKTDGVASVNAGATVSYTIVVSNAGSSTGDGAVFTDPVVANFAASAVTCGGAIGGGACPLPGNTTVALMQGGGIVIPTMPSGSSVTFSVTGTAGASGNIVNTATVTAPAGTTDPTPGNNTASDTDTIAAPTSNGAISGHIWYDLNGNHVREGGESGRSGWQVELILAGNVVSTATTDTTGLYSFAGLAPGSYSIRFINPNGSTLISGPAPVNGETGTPLASGGTPSLSQLSNIALTADGNGNVSSIGQQSLPIDPSGVVYNSATRQPIAGATVTLLYNGSPINSTLLAGGSATQVTGADGAYAFFLLPAAAAGTYSLVASASAYVFPSTVIAATAAPGGFTGGAVTAITGVPQSGQDTLYYQQFPLPTTDITNNNLPLDAVLSAVPGAAPIPSLNTWGIIFMTLVLAAASIWHLRRDVLTLGLNGE